MNNIVTILEHISLNAHSMKLSSAMIDRLTLTEERINGMIISISHLLKVEDVK